MGHYRLTEEAKADLIRIHKYGVLRFGEAQAEKYFMAFFDERKFAAWTIAIPYIS